MRRWFAAFREAVHRRWWFWMDRRTERQIAQLSYRLATIKKRRVELGMEVSAEDRYGRPTRALRSRHERFYRA